jgi:hypothetical protein
MRTAIKILILIAICWTVVHSVGCAIESLQKSVQNCQKHAEALANVR